MAILDTSIVIERFKSNEEINENITIVTLIEFPRISSYILFKGSAYFPTIDDYSLAFELQTRDRDFEDISKISNLKLTVLDNS